MTNERKDLFMTLRRLAFVSCLTTAFLLLGNVARAQDAGPVKVAVCSPARVFGDMQETKDLKQKLEADTKAIQSDANSRQQKVKDLQAQRDLLKPDSAQFQEADATFMKAAIEFDTWTKITSAQLQGQQKQQ